MIFNRVLLYSLIIAIALHIFRVHAYGVSNKLRVYNSTSVSEQKIRTEINKTLRVVKKRVGGKWKARSYHTFNDTSEGTYQERFTQLYEQYSEQKPNYVVMFIESDTFSFGRATVCGVRNFVVIGLANDRKGVGDAEKNFIPATLAQELLHNQGARDNDDMSLMYSFWHDWHTTTLKRKRWRVLANDRKEICRCEHLYSFIKSEMCK